MIKTLIHILDNRISNINQRFEWNLIYLHVLRSIQ